MARKKKSISETSTELVEDSAAVIEAVEEKQASPELAECLSKLNERLEVLGYILRDTNAATINLKEPEKIVEYAILGSEALEAGQEISQLFNLGEFRCAIVERKETKALCFLINENRINVFMKKDADHAEILSNVRE